MEEDEVNSIAKNNFEKIGISKLSEKIEKIDSKMKAFETTINNFMSSHKKTTKPENE